MKGAFLLLFFILCTTLFAQKIDTSNISIVRDQWGVPHIFSQTDEEAAYGLAWAHSEDNFKDIQEPLLAVRGLLGSVVGKDGALLDAVAYLIKANEVVEEKFESSFSPKFKNILAAYTSAINRYAELHPEEVRHKKLFPISEKELIKGYVLSFTFISNVQYDLARLFQNNIAPIANIDKNKLPGGSNGFAFAPKKTKEGKTFLVSNSHQPLRGFMAWYEVHIHSEEGWNFLGATFAGGITPFIGTNEHLGWTHCVNYNDYHDVYELKMHPKGKKQYLFDGEWLDLEERVFKTKVKLGFLKIGIRKKFYWSKHGPVVKNKSGFYALRFPSNMVVGQAEQWYHMNKATNLEAFKKAQELQQIPSLATIYADKESNILFIDNGLFPYRNPNYNWKKIVPGDTSATLWAPNFMPMDSILMIENPSSGYVFHTNGSGFYTSAPDDCPKPSDYNKTIGYMEEYTPRQLRVINLIDPEDKISYADLKIIKYDLKREFPLYAPIATNWDSIRHLSGTKYPHLAEILSALKQWDGNTDVHNKQAAIYSLSSKYILGELDKQGRLTVPGMLSDKLMVAALNYTKKYLLKHFGKLEIELGELQKHVRGDKVLPVGGVSETLAAMYMEPYKKGMMQSAMGESFILFATYNKNGVEKIETVNCYGASNHPGSPHYSDQMELFLKHELKPMTLDKKEVLTMAKRNYHPR